MRYQHLTKFLSEEELSTLHEKTVSVVGLGGIGSCVAELLVRSGISLRIVEKDRVLEEDMDRLSMFSNKHVSKFKATEAKKLLNKINPEVIVKSFNEEVTVQSLFLMDADLVLDCSGNNDLTPLISSYCAKNGIACIAGGIRGTQGIVIRSTKEKTVQDHLDDLPFERTEGLIPSASRIVAGMMYVKALKALLAKDDDKPVVVYDIWNQESVSASQKPKKSAKKKGSEKKPVKKKASSKKSAKKISTKKKSAKKKTSSKTSTKKKSSKK